MLMHAWQAGKVEIAGGHLAFHRTGGDGPALVLSHGLTDNGLCWTRLAAALAPQYDIVMLDARGHGESSRIGGVTYDPGEDIAEAIQCLGLVAPVVMGHSIGARATALCAGAHPALVSKVILENPAFLPPVDAAKAEKRREDFRRHVEKFHAMSNAEITAAGREQSPDWHDDEFPAWAASKKQVDPAALPEHSVSWQDAVARIEAPTLLICGEGVRGSIVSPETAAEAERINPSVTSVRIRNAGHNIRRENFADYLAVVNSFLTST